MKKTIHIPKKNNIQGFGGGFMLNKWIRANLETAVGYVRYALRRDAPAASSGQL